MSNYAYTGLTLNGQFSDDGEYFQVSFELNGVPIRFGNVYVGDQREAFIEAKQNKTSGASESDQTTQG